jgi:predicted MFS family arabinose efflux permease
MIAYATLAAGTALAMLSWSGHVWIAATLIAIVGFGILVTSVSINMILQSIVHDDKRGRVMSLYTAAFVGMSPFGAVAAGALADVVGIAVTLTAGGVACAFAGLYLARRREQVNIEPR